MIYPALQAIDGRIVPRPVYGIEVLPPGEEPSLYAMSLDKSAIEEYLEVCQQTTKPEHWRIVELQVS